MKKTLTINLNNSVFHIDEDAYELLQSYLTEVGNHFKSENEKADIMADIEARIAELFNEKMDKLKNVITLEDVDAVITIMGKPSQFVDEEETEEGKDENQSATTETTSKHRTRKYYRDIDNQLLSGVAAGLAAYLNWDVTIVRIIFIALTFLTSGTFILIYLLMWIIVPKAVTTAQKLEMHGEDVNIETIKNKMNDAKEYVESGKLKENATEVGSGIWRVIRVILKVLFTIVISVIGIVGVIVIVSLILALIVYLFQPDVITAFHPGISNLLTDISPDKVILVIISLLFLIGSPIFALFYWGIGFNSKEKKTRSHTPLWIALVLWLAGIFMFVGAGSEVVKKLKDNDFIAFYDEDNGNMNANIVTESRQVPQFNAIEVQGAIKLDLTQSEDSNALSVSSLKGYLPNIKTEVTDGKLRIYSVDHLINPDIHVKIAMDSLTAIVAQGASIINFETPFKVKRMDVDMEGASKANLDFTSAQKLSFDLKGASKMNMKGNADTLTISSEGASKIEAGEMLSKVVKVELAGASKAEVYAIDSFEGQAFGASKITCKGNPTRRSNQSNTGSSINYEN